jgi:AcrR family transcriptional regulator
MTLDTKPSDELGADSTRQRIITAAARLFGRIGYSRATTRAIATEAGVNEVTLFRIFGNKGNLLLAVVEGAVFSGFAATFEAQLTGDYSEDIQVMARAQMAATVKGFDIVRLLMCDAQAVPQLQEIMMSGARQNLAFIAGYFQKQIDRGLLRRDLDPQILAHAFDSLFSSTIFWQTMFQEHPDPQLLPEVTIAQLVSIFIKGTVVPSK